MSERSREPHETGEPPHMREPESTRGPENPRQPQMIREPQNIYDDATFLAGYSTLERFGAGWTRAMEHGELLGLLPDVGGRRVLDLGCGAGQLAHHLAMRGAAEVMGVDVSERMLALARSEFSHPAVTYRRASIED